MTGSSPARRMGRGHRRGGTAGRRIGGRSIRTITKPKVVAAQLRAGEAVQLRAQGHTYTAIAGRLGYRSPQAAHDAIRRTLQRASTALADEYLGLELERLELLIRAVMPKAVTGDFAAISRALSIMDLQSRLLGLYQNAARGRAGHVQTAPCADVISGAADPVTGLLAEGRQEAADG